MDEGHAPLLPPNVQKLLEEVYGCFGDRKRLKAAEDPLGCLGDLLQTVRERLEEPSAMLYSTIQQATFDQQLQAPKPRRSQRAS